MMRWWTTTLCYCVIKCLLTVDGGDDDVLTMLIVDTYALDSQFCIMILSSGSMKSARIIPRLSLNAIASSDAFQEEELVCVCPTMRWGLMWFGLQEVRNKDICICYP